MIMSLKKYRIDLSSIHNIEDLIKVLNSLGLTYVVDTSKPDPRFEKFQKMGIIKEEMKGVPVVCDLCGHKFTSAFVNEKVKCPCCKSNTYVEPV